MVAHAGSVIEVRKENGSWSVVPDSRYARRITLDTEMRIAGPAAGQDRMKTNYDPTGTKVFGTMNNCAGGRTPWGTAIMAGEIFHGYFGSASEEEVSEVAGMEAANYARYGVPDGRYPWWRTVDATPIGMARALHDGIRGSSKDCRPQATGTIMQDAAIGAVLERTAERMN